MNDLDLQFRLMRAGIRRNHVWAEVNKAAETNKAEKEGMAVKKANILRIKK